jgi:hypothetical protein
MPWERPTATLLKTLLNKVDNFKSFISKHITTQVFRLEAEGYKTSHKARIKPLRGDGSGPSSSI